MTNPQLNNQIETVVGISRLRWFLIVLLFFVNLSSTLIHAEIWTQLSPIITTVCLFSIAWLHGVERYGNKQMFLFLLIVWVISNTFETLSIHTGFPFGHYHYQNLMGIRIFQVPIVIMPAYFGMGYISWTVAHSFVGHKYRTFMVPVVAAGLMVLWDLSMDPIMSTIDSDWIWEQGGSYFGVPLSSLK